MRDRDRIANGARVNERVIPDRDLAGSLVMEESRSTFPIPRAGGPAHRILIQLEIDRRLMCHTVGRPEAVCGVVVAYDDRASPPGIDASGAEIARGREVIEVVLDEDVVRRPANGR